MKTSFSGVFWGFMWFLKILLTISGFVIKKVGLSIFIFQNPFPLLVLNKYTIYIVYLIWLLTNFQRIKRARRGGRRATATFFELSTLLLQACSVMAWCLVEKWTIGKLVWIWFDNVSSISPKYVTYRQKISKIWFWASNSIFFNFDAHSIMLACTNEK